MYMHVLGCSTHIRCCDALGYTTYIHTSYITRPALPRMLGAYAAFFAQRRGTRRSPRHAPSSVSPYHTPPPPPARAPAVGASMHTTAQLAGAPSCNNRSTRSSFLLRPKQHGTRSAAHILRMLGHSIRERLCQPSIVALAHHPRTPLAAAHAARIPAAHAPRTSVQALAYLHARRDDGTRPCF